MKTWKFLRPGDLVRFKNGAEELVGTVNGMPKMDWPEDPDIGEGYVPVYVRETDDCMLVAESNLVEKIAKETAATREP